MYLICKSGRCYLVEERERERERERVWVNEEERGDIEKEKGKRERSLPVSFVKNRKPKKMGRVDRFIKKNRNIKRGEKANYERGGKKENERVMEEGKLKK